MYRATTAIAALVLVAAPAVAATAESKLPFPELARDLRGRCGLGEEDPAGLSLDRLLASGRYVGLDLGTFEIWYPAWELGEKGRAEDFQKAVEAIVELHRAWMDYAYHGTPAEDAGAADLDVLGKWVKSWSGGTLRKLEPEGSPSLYDLLGAKEEVVAAARDLRSLVEHGVKERAWDGGWKEEGIHVTRIVLCPSRRSLLEHAAFAGEIDLEMRPTLWIDEMAQRSSAWCGRTQLVAMENAVFPIDDKDPYRGSSMDFYSKNGMEQSIVERAANSLLRDIYYYLGTHFFEDALATNLVIAVCGENLVGFSWSWGVQRQGASTEGYSRFVPGGNPNGGALPQRLARPGPLQGYVGYISDWAKSAGKDYYLDPLRKSQKDGAKEAAKDKERENRKDKTAHFLIKNEAGGRAVLSAPFFGPDAEGKVLPPNEFLDDYEEFFKAYRSAFFEWIRLHAGKDEDDSRAKFAALIEAQATRDKDAPLHQVVEGVYGQPLSGPDGEGDSLEWRFLSWLAKGK